MTYLESIALGMKIAAELREHHNNGHPVFVFSDDQRSFMVNAGYRGAVIVVDSREASLLAAIFRSDNEEQRRALYESLIHSAKSRQAAMIKTKLTSSLPDGNPPKA